MNKPYHLMTPAERLADRIARNRDIDQKAASEPPKPAKSPGRGSRKGATADDAAIASRQSAVRSRLDQFQKIKNTQGIDAASDFILGNLKD